MAIIIGSLIAVIVILVVYIAFIQSQIRNMSRQLKKRLREHTRQPISLELINSDLIALAVILNQCFEAEETLRLNNLREEKRFKEMIADLSHDLRTPLTAIKGYQQLLDTIDLTEEQHKKLQIARRHTQELGMLIEHFFEYSYLVSTIPELHPERLNLTNLITEGLIAEIAVLEENDLKVSLDEMTPPIFLTTDKEMVMRIVHNLIRNGIQHADGDITVRLLAEQEAIISFRNSVRQSEDIDVKKIFDRFYTGDHARSRSTGLGLSIVKLLAQQLGGNVSAIKEGDQLEIRVLLPLTECTRS